MFSFLHCVVSSFLRFFASSFLHVFVSSFLRFFVSSFLRSFVSPFLRVSVSSCLRFSISSFLRFFVSLVLRFFVSSFHYQMFTPCFLEDIDLISNIVKILLDDSSYICWSHIFENFQKMRFAICILPKNMMR